MAFQLDSSIPFKQKTVSDYMQENEDRAIKNQALQATLSQKLKGNAGGATGELIQRYMDATGATFPEALQAVQSGMRQNMLYQNGQMAPIPGAAEAKGVLKAGERMGEKQVDLQMNPAIKRGESDAANMSDLGYKPVIANNTARQSEVGKQLGETDANLIASESAMPQLETAVKKLSDLGKTATYTTMGRGANTIKREIGAPVGEGAESRAAYISHVKNNVLPLLRQTFGAQFTKAEGDSLLATLGDPNSSPEEKDAVLNSFIEDKRASLDTMRRATGRPTLNTPIITQPQKTIVKTQISPSTGKRKIIYSDGTEEIQ